MQGRISIAFALWILVRIKALWAGPRNADFCGLFLHACWLCRLTSCGWPKATIMRSRRICRDRRKASGRVALRRLPPHPRRFCVRCARLCARARRARPRALRRPRWWPPPRGFPFPGSQDSSPILPRSYLAAPLRCRSLTERLRSSWRIRLASGWAGVFLPIFTVLASNHEAVPLTCREAIFEDYRSKPCIRRGTPLSSSSSS